jgi:hypothetical protein
MPRRHSSGRKDYSTRTERRSANQYQNITLINRPPPAYLLLALGFVEVVLLYAGLHLSVGYALFYKCRVPHFVWHTLVGDTEDRILRLVQGSMRRGLSLHSLISNAGCGIHHFVRILCFEANRV